MEKKYPIGRVVNLGSSSLGNSFYIEIFRDGYANPFKLLIECGFPFTELTTRLLNKGISINHIDCVLVTHEHLDHAKSVPNLIKRGKKVYAPKTVFERFNLMEEIDKKFIIEEFVSKGIADGIRVFGLPLDHENDDGSKTYNLAYVITINKDFNILYVSDTKHIRWDLSEYQFNVIFIEANYETRVLYHALKTAKENNDSNRIHFERVLKSHMSLQNTGKTLQTFDLSKTDTIYLIHITANSTTNPFVYKDYIIKSIKKMGYKKIPRIVVAKRNGDFT